MLGRGGPHKYFNVGPVGGHKKTLEIKGKT